MLALVIIAWTTLAISTFCLFGTHNDRVSSSRSSYDVWDLLELVIGVVVRIFWGEFLLLSLDILSKLKH